jgi:DNA-binding MarR family transcriptional regulator
VGYDVTGSSKKPRQAYLVDLFARADHALMVSFEAQVKSRGLSFIEWRVLKTLMAHDGMRIIDIAKHVLSLQETVTKAVDRMERSKLVQRRTPSEDRRRKSVHLTERGKRVVRPLAALAHQRDLAVERALGVSASRELKVALAQLIELIREPGIIGRHGQVQRRSRFRRLTTRDFREALAEVVEVSEKPNEPLVLTRHGRDRAALVSIDDLWIIELVNSLGVHDVLAACESTEVAVSHLEMAAERYLNDHLCDDRLNFSGARLRQLIVRYKLALTQHLFDVSVFANTPSGWRGRWSGTHLIAAALADGRSLGLNDQDQCLLVAALMAVIKESVEQIASRAVAAVDAMHTVIELLETTAAAIATTGTHDDTPVADRFAKDFADIVCGSGYELAQCLLVWCVGELTERGDSMKALARRMAEALLAANPPDRARKALRMICEHGELANHPPLKEFRRTAPADEQAGFDEKARSVGRGIERQLAKRGILETPGAESVFAGVGALLAEAGNGPPLTTLLAVRAVRRVLKDAGRKVSPDQQRAFVEASCRYIVNCRRKDPSLPFFVIAETLEAVRDVFKRMFAETSAKLIDPGDPQLTHVITVCVAEGAEAEVAGLKDTRVEVPRFEIRLAAKEHAICVFHPGNTPSQFTEFWIALADCVSRNPQLGGVSPMWVTDRLNVYQRGLRHPT